MPSHELGDLCRDSQAYWVSVCSCGWESIGFRQRRYAMKEYADHVFEMTETSLKGSNQ